MENLDISEFADQMVLFPIEINKLCSVLQLFYDNYCKIIKKLHFSIVKGLIYI